MRVLPLGLMVAHGAHDREGESRGQLLEQLVFPSGSRLGEIPYHDSKGDSLLTGRHVLKRQLGVPVGRAVSQVAVRREHEGEVGQDASAQLAEGLISGIRSLGESR